MDIPKELAEAKKMQQQVMNELKALGQRRELLAAQANKLLGRIEVLEELAEKDGQPGAG